MFVLKNSPLYAIVDIETTGGYAIKSKITEIAIYIFDGEKIVDEYQTLVNPEQNIPFHIQTLTGITPEMVEFAPKFEDVAKEIHHFLEDKIFVAHNVNFDYGFIYNQLKEVGINWQANKLCTVRLARKIIPGKNSYSLGNLCQNLNIRLENRHRAAGDALATVKLFQLLIDQDHEGLIISTAKNQSKTQRLPTNVTLENFNQLPETTGIYFFRDQKGKIIYVGKAINIKKRVSSHFTGNDNSKKRQDFLNDIFHLDFIETGNELMALLTEFEYIKQHWPKHNKALKGFDPKYGITSYLDQNNYLRLAIIKINKQTNCIYYFDQVHEATTTLIDLVNKHHLNHLLCTYYNEDPLDKQAKNNELKNLKLEDSKLYNEKVYRAFDDLEHKNQSFYIIDKGRLNEEKSYVYIKNNQVYAKGYFDTQFEQNLEEIVKEKDRCESHYYLMQLIKKYKIEHPENIFQLT